MTQLAYKSAAPPRISEHDQRFIFQLEMRHGKPECALECDEFSVRRAATVFEYADTNSLVKEMYSRKGYTTDGVVNMPRRENTITLDAHDSDKIMGTLTVRLDSRQTGLLADALYAKEIDAIRQNGRTVCEVSKLAVDPRFGSKELMASLFQLAYLYAHVIHRVHDAFIEVNPRHAGFYKRMLGFREIGELRTCPRVNAPAVLLHVELDYMREQIDRHSGRGYCASEKSLYPYFLSCGAEDWIHRAMRTKVNRPH
ncbi:MAG: Long chain N-acyltyrosine synthase [Betaproteobacteria bacterium]|nr:Long chain N-acyltyrosine synthase [Betaproteobacteria bacterium]